MTANSDQPVEDPLVAALPPETDYITYLTLLEYQLNATNLPTLNRILSDDDGTLAAEIGWDLLKLVLPMLQVVSDEANKCLQIIARRGNPREVIVKVAEELQHLDEHESSGDESNGDDDTDDPDELPTFAGEAPRVHLGRMTLDGMPPHPDAKSHAFTDESTGLTENGAVSGSDNVLSFKALLSMLGILHPRIKTQYPSRFLATSLPAALGAFRRLPITAETTTAFVDLLGKLSGKQRPVLPPRTSTTGSMTAKPGGNASNTSVTAPLPDPEDKVASADSIARSLPSPVEKSVVEKLLQAVLSEVLDEYMHSFADSQHSTMSWTCRLRELHEHSRVVPRRTSESESWEEDPELIIRDKLAIRILRLSKDLNLDIVREFTKASQVHEDPSSAIDEIESDYPTKPSDIPFARAGLTLLYAARYYYRQLSFDGSQTYEYPLLSVLLRSFQANDNLSDGSHLASQDASLSLIFTTIMKPSDVKDDLNQQELFGLLTSLCEVFTTSPDPTTRDNAHHIAGMIFRSKADAHTKISIVSHLLLPAFGSSSPIHRIQAGNLKSIAIDWLKGALLAKTLNPVSASSEESQITDLILEAMPSVPASPGPFISSHPPNSVSAPSMSSDLDLETLLLHIPAYISGLNLICVLAPLPASYFSTDQKTTSDTSDTSDPQNSSVLSGPIHERATIFISSLQGWKDMLLALATAARPATNEEGPIHLADLYALEDALGRATEAMGKIEVHDS